MYIKVKYLKDGVQSKRSYTFETDIPVKNGDVVSLGNATGVVVETDVPEEEVAEFKDKIKKIDGKIKKFRVTNGTDYIMGYLRHGRRKGMIEATSKEDALNKLKNHGYTNYLDFELDDYSVEDIGYSGDFEIEEVEED